MLRFAAKRLLTLVPLLLGVSLAVFVLLRTVGDDPALSLLRLSGIPPTEEALARARAGLGLDGSIAAQYADWLARAVRLDFGRSYVTGEEVLPQILLRLPNTLLLGAAALLFTIAIGIPLGVLGAAFRDRWPDRLCRALAAAGVSAPGFWTGFLLIALFSVKLGWLPPTGSLLMPALATGLMPMCVIMRLTRNAMLAHLHSRPVLYARLRGVTEGRILAGHVLRHALAPVAAALGMQAGEILGGAVVAETVFAWPGIGRHAVDALMNRDFPVTQCLVPALTLVFALCTLGADCLHAAADPRARMTEDARRG